MKKIFVAPLLAVALISQGFLAMPAAAQVLGQTSVAYPYYPQPTSYCPQLSYNLYRGLSDYYTGGQVTQLQQFLASQGYYQPVTGYFGSLTWANVAQFQRQYSIYPVTGGVGPLTRAAIAGLCYGGGVPTSGTFYLNQPFTLYINQTAQQYNGQLDVTLNSVSNPLYTTTLYPGYNWGQSATVTLGQRCQAGTQCFYYPTQKVTLTVGQSTTWQGYTITLNSISGNGATFTVTSGGGTVGGLTVTSPTAGQVYARGSIMPITWSYPVTPGSNVAVVLDLYTAAGSKVGTIAISSQTMGTTNWTVPVPNTVCTMQYPNGLCGQSLSGQYYIKATVVSGNGFDSNATTLATAQSGTFSIQ